MKKLGIAVVLSLVVVLSISAANAGVWEDYFSDDPIFDGGVFVNDTVETDITEEPEEIEKDWLEHDVEMFPPGWFNITRPKTFPEDWSNETQHSNFPVGYFDETPREFYTDKPDGWFEVVGWGTDIRYY